jgi:uncharacterized membrane protein YhaH (DUF805 family)
MRGAERVSEIICDSNPANGRATVCASRWVTAPGAGTVLRRTSARARQPIGRRGLCTSQESSLHLAPGTVRAGVELVLKATTTEDRMHWYLDVLKKYAVFSGRARRKEYWMFVLFNLIVAWVLLAIDYLIGTDYGRGNGVLYTVYSVAVFLPSLAVFVRRLHDTGRSGWWFFIGFVPLVGWIILLVFMVLDGQSSANQYGENPKLA